MINSVSRITNKTEVGMKLIDYIRFEFSSHQSALPVLTAAYFIWKNPWMTAGGDTFISDMLNRAGFKNVFEDDFRYPEISMETVKEKRPDVILLSTEPFPFGRDDIAEFKSLMADTSVVIVDGEMFSWYGSRMKLAPSYFLKLREKIHSPL